MLAVVLLLTNPTKRASFSSTSFRGSVVFSLAQMSDFELARPTADGEVHGKMWSSVCNGGIFESALRNFGIGGDGCTEPVRIRFCGSLNPDASESKVFREIK
jgi:hypothetical protein